MTLWKIKRPAGRGWFDLELVGEDKLGVWLYGARGSKWGNPTASGTLPFSVLVLLNPAQYYVAWWVNDPGDRRLEIDICLPPQREDDGWSYVDLELDPVRHEDGTTEIQDSDEFEDACRNGWIFPEHAEMAKLVAGTMAKVLRQREEPFGEEGWHRLRRKHSISD